MAVRRTLGLVVAALLLSAADSSPPPHLALVIKTFRNPYFENMVDGAEDGAADLGATIEVAASDYETSIDQQIGLIDRLVDEKVGGIILTPADSKRLVPALKRAQDAGIPIVNLDNPIDRATAAAAGLKPVPLVAVDNKDAAYRAVRAALAGFPASPRPIKVAIVEGIRGAENGEERKAGALEALRENTRAVLVASESGEWERDKGEAVAADLIRRFPDLDLLFCANDNMALGALPALAMANASRVKVVGYDALPEALDAVRAGTLAVTVDQRAARQGRMGVEYLLKLIRGEPVPPETLVDVRIVQR